MWAVAVAVACGTVGLSVPESAIARTAAVAQAAAPADQQVNRDGVPAPVQKVQTVHKVCHHHVCDTCNKCDNCHKCDKCDKCKNGDRGPRGPRGPQGLPGLPGRTGDISTLFVPGPVPGGPDGVTFTALTPGDGSVQLRDSRGGGIWQEIVDPDNVISVALAGPIPVPGSFAIRLTVLERNGDVETAICTNTGITVTCGAFADISPV